MTLCTSTDSRSIKPARATDNEDKWETANQKCTHKQNKKKKSFSHIIIQYIICFLWWWQICQGYWQTIVNSIWLLVLLLSFYNRTLRLQQRAQYPFVIYGLWSTCPFPQPQGFCLLSAPWAGSEWDVQLLDIKHSNVENCLSQGKLKGINN